MNSTKQTARHAGILYLLLGLSAPIGLEFVPGKLIESGNAEVTANNIRESEMLFRIGIVSELFSQVIVIYLVLVLYRLFKPVNERWSKQLAVLGALVSVPIAFVSVLWELGALTILRRPDFLAVFDPDQADALAYLFLRLNGLGITITSIFWGLWLFPFGLLVIRSGFIPGWLGILLIIAGSAYIISALTTLLFPRYKEIINSVAMILEIGEVPIIFWLLIWGARTKDIDMPTARIE